jgi:tetraacyldisaccharide 4'-kinase
VRRALGALFGGATALRVAAYRRGWLRRERLQGPVVSVGNLSLGGRSKTPVVALIVSLLQAEGHQVAVLSRGYKGSYRGEALLVSDGERVLAQAGEAGDEPVMLAHMLPGAVVAVARRRAAGGRLVEQRFGRRVFVLDDGFQHLSLARNLDLLCLEARDLWDRPLPAGRLREPPRAQARADLVLLSTEGADPATRKAAVDLLGPERTHLASRRVEGVFSLDGSPASLPRRPFLLAGIAGPERFAADVRGLGLASAGAHFFEDHHAFRPNDLATVTSEANACQADAILTTAKDAVRLPPAATARLPVLVLRIAAVIEDQERFKARLLAAISPRAA